MSDELAQGGVIEPSELTIFGNGSPESFWLPKDVEVKPVGDALPIPEIDIKCHPFTSEADLRRFIRKEVHAALDDLAREMRVGITFQPTTTRKQAGICYACLCAGDDMERFEQAGQGVWIHKNDECRQRAVMIAAHGEHKG